MELKTYNTLNASNLSSGKPVIAFSATSGVMRINKTAIEALQIKNGERWAISQDVKNVKDWYLHQDAENGFIIRVNEKNEGMFNSKTTCEDIRACLKNLDETKSVKMLLVVKPTVENEINYYPILTSSAH